MTEITDITNVHVAVAKPLRQLYTYSLPNDMAAPEVGARVRVPFGRQILVGMCMAITHTKESTPRKLKALQEILDANAILSPELLALARWAADYYHYPIGEVVFAALPMLARQGASLKPDIDSLWRLVDDVETSAPANASRLLAALSLLQDGAQAESALRALGVQMQTLRNLETKGWIEKCEDIQPANVPYVISDSPFMLTLEQETVFAALDLGSYHCYLLNGVTGSGKTEVYLRAIARVLQPPLQEQLQEQLKEPLKEPDDQQQKQVLVLVPEIALTPQTLARFQARFKGVDIMHSGLSNRARTNAWLKCKSGDTRILIGTRSAVFTAFNNLALIVVD